MRLKLLGGERVTESSVALAHDYLLVMRGAERTFLEIAREYDESPITTLLYEPALVATELPGREIRASGLQRLRLNQSNFRSLLPIMPLAARSLHVSQSDVVIASSSAFSHGFKVDIDTRLICYCHSPFRYAWHERQRGLQEVPAAIRPVLGATLGAIGRWDVHVQRRIDHVIANSVATQSRVRDYWGRDAILLHPPVSIERFALGKPEDWFLIVCELVRHKRVDVALEAARLAGRRVRVVGSGPDEARLRSLYGDVGEFLGRVPDEELAQLYGRAAAVIVPNVEEFGIVAVEAQAAGRPVVGANVGGTAETVVNGETGVLVDVDNFGELVEALREVDYGRFDPAAAVESAGRFSATRFRARLRQLVFDWMSE